MLKRFGLAGVIEVPSRRTGASRHVCVVVHEIGGARYILSTYGHSLWVGDLRAAGRGRLAFRGRSEPFVSVELEPTERDEIIEFYRKRAPRPFQRDFDLRPDPADHPALPARSRSGRRRDQRAGGGRAERLEAAVRVQAAEPERPGVRHEHHPEPDDEQQRRRPAGPRALVARVQVDRVGQPGDERRGLLRVPAPVARPGDRRPPRARG